MKVEWTEMEIFEVENAQRYISVSKLSQNCLGHVFSPSLFNKSSQKLLKKPKVAFTIQIQIIQALTT